MQNLETTEKKTALATFLVMVTGWYILAVIAGEILAGAAVRLFGGEVPAGREALIAALIGGVLNTGFLILLLKRRNLLSLRIVNWKQSLIKGTLVFAAITAFSTLIVAVAKEMGVGSVSWDSGFVDRSLLAFLALAIVTPVSEELLFRGALFGALRKHKVFLLPAVASSLLFAVCHGTVMEMIIAFGTGMLLCLLYEKTGSLLPGMLVHALNNALALLDLEKLTAGIAPLFGKALWLAARSLYSFIS